MKAAYFRKAKKEKKNEVVVVRRTTRFILSVLFKKISVFENQQMEVKAAKTTTATKTSI